MRRSCKAHAKINLGLGVIARRGDGFHELDTIFARLQLHDLLSAESIASAGESSLQVSMPEPLPGGDLLDAGNHNLVLRAAKLYQERTGSPDAAFILTKRIPLAAGLGGGSADAAAALQLLDQLHPAGADLPLLARELGSDVPFFLTGWSAARGRGRGERLEQLGLPRRTVVLANPLVPVSSEEAYADLQNFSRRLNPAAISAALASGTNPRYVNALQSGVTRTRPQIRAVLLALRAAGLEGVLLSGSGATCFGFAHDEQHATEAALQLRTEQPGWWVHIDAVGG